MARRFTPGQARQIGSCIKAARLERGLSLAQLAVRCQTHHSQVSRMEHGKFVLLAGNVQTVCTFLQIEADPEDGATPDLADLHSKLENLLKRKPEVAQALGTILSALQSISDP